MGPALGLDLGLALAAFLQFALFAAALLRMGSALVPGTPDSRAEFRFIALALGSALAYCIAHVLTAAGLFGSDHRLLLWCVLATAWLLPSRPMPPKAQGLISGFIPIGVLVTLKLIEGLQLSAHGDAYITYLSAPRSWGSSGGFDLYPRYTQFFLASSWESLTAWGTALMGLSGGRGLELTQWFGQWCTGGIAVTGLALGFLSLGLRLAPAVCGSRPWPTWIWSCLAVAAIQVPCLRWMANLAKADFGACFWGLAALWMVIWPGRSGSILLAGFMAGTAAIAKLTLAPFVLVLAASLPIRALPLFGAGGIVGAAPVLIRNLVLTGNPVFPWLSNWFAASALAPRLGLSEGAGSLHATSITSVSVASASGILEALPVFMREIWREVPLLPLLLVLILPQARGLPRRLGAIAIASALLFSLTLRQSTEIRYQGPTLMLLAFLSALCGLALLGRGAGRIGAAIGALALLAASNLSLFTFAQIGSSKFASFPGRAEALADTGGPAKLWIRKNLKPTDPLLVMRDGYPYYLIDHQMTQYSRVDGLEELLATGRIRELAGRLRSKLAAPDFKYLYLSSRADYVAYRPAISSLMALGRKDWPGRCLRFEDADAQVWDLECIR